MAKRKYFKNVPIDWIDAQRIGCLAWIILQKESFSEGRIKSYFPRLVRSFDQQAGRLGLTKPFPRLNLPSSVLDICSTPELLELMPTQKKLLKDIADSNAQLSRDRHLHKNVDGTKLSMKTCSEREAAGIVAQMILFSDLPAKSVANAINFFFGMKFKEVFSEASRLQSLLDEIRDPQNTSAETLKSINRFDSLLSRMSGMSRYIQNALLEAVFFWPLLVFKETKKERERARLKISDASDLGCYSYPIAVDINYDNKNRVKIILPTDIPDRQMEDFKAQVSVALDVAKGLWRSKNGHVRERWQEVKLASCCLDFSYAEKICFRTGIDPLWQDYSAQAYFVQAFLTKFIGRHVTMNAAISGRVGTKRKQYAKPNIADEFPKNFSICTNDLQTTQDYLSIYNKMKQSGKLNSYSTKVTSQDRWIDKVSSQNSKFSFAARSNKYRKIVLHPDNEISERAATENRYLEINYARTNVAVADAVQIGGWRPHQYYRSPDIGHLIHKDSTLLPNISHDLVSLSQDELVDTNNALAHLNDEHSVLSIAALLNYANYEYRFSKKKTPASLSWAFIRVLDKETDFRFWRMFLKAIGASDLAIHENHRRADPKFTANLIASIINGDSYSEKLGCFSSPDIVVVFSARTAARENLSSLEKKSLPQDFSRVIGELSQLELKPLRQDFEDILGKTRILFVDEDVRYMNVSYFKLLSELPENKDVDKQIFDKLSIFEFGFTSQMAHEILRDMHVNIAQTREELHRLADKRFLWKSGRKFFLPHALRPKDKKFSKEEITSLKRVATSLIPGIESSASSGYSVAECFQVEQIRFVQFYLEKCVSMINSSLNSLKGEERAKMLELRKQIFLEQSVVSRFFDISSWGTINFLNKSPGIFRRYEILLFAQQLLDESETRSERDNPGAYTMCATATLNAMKEAHKANRHHQTLKLKTLAESLFEKGFEFVEAIEDENNRKDWEVHVATRQFMSFLRMNQYFGKDRNNSKYLFSLKALGQANTKLMKIVEEREIFGIFPDAEWFVHRGDRSASEGLAKDLFFRAILFSPSFYQTYPRFFGVGRPEDIVALLNSSPGKNYWSKQIMLAYKWCMEHKYLIFKNTSRETRHLLHSGLSKMEKYLKL